MGFFFGTFLFESWRGQSLATPVQTGNVLFRIDFGGGQGVTRGIEQWLSQFLKILKKMTKLSFSRGSSKNYNDLVGKTKPAHCRRALEPVAKGCGGRLRLQNSP